MKAVNIQWNVDEERELKLLPDHVDIPSDMNKDAVADYISSLTGWCTMGFEISDEKTFFDIKEGDFVIVNNHYNHDYREHVLKVESVDCTAENTTIENLPGMVCYGRDLTTYSDEAEDYICSFTKDDFVGFYEPYDYETEIL